jgi:hypothetical protein
MTEFCKFLIYETTRFLAPVPVAVEWVIAILGALAVALIPLRRGLPRLRRAVHALSERRRWAIIVCGLLPVAVRLSLLAVMPAPEPSIHDEFSHLLLGDTLAHGRLANPPHPMWRHFESIHIIQQPTYSSMYPPAQGVFLAAGEVLFHEPWAGVVISVGLMGMAVCWMMQGWLPSAWAFYGALLCGLKLGIGGLWINSYIGGAAGAIGGALLFGALPRLRRDGRGLDAALFGLGMVILMNSRPFDGAILSAASIAYLVCAKKQRAIVDLLPAAAVLAIGVAFTGYYDWRVTGSPLRMAYQVNRDTYGWPENLAFLPAKKLTLRDPVMESMYLKEVARREIYQHPDKLADDYLTRLFDNWSYFIGPLLTIPLVFLPWVLRDRRARLLVIFVALVAVLNLFQLVLYPYHLAPLVGVIFAIVTQGLRHLYVSLPRSRRVGLLLALPVCVGLTVAMKANADDLVITLPYWDRTAEWHRDARVSIAEWLKRRPGKQLVVVRYGRFHEVNQEWVYNGADIDGSKIVWAREVDPRSDAELLSYFRDREAWLLEADVMPVRVVKYPRPAAIVEKLPEISRK